MATRAEIIESTSRTLRYGHAFLDEVPEMIAEWEEVPENEWLNWMLDWDQFIIVHMARLNERAAAGQMADDQLVEYRRLIQRIIEQRPIYEQYGMGVPEVPVSIA